jgi:hypothetical protein
VGGTNLLSLFGATFFSFSFSSGISWALFPESFSSEKISESAESFFSLSTLVDISSSFFISFLYSLVNALCLPFVCPLSALCLPSSVSSSELLFA